jgi:hypothetical protein
MHHKKIEFKNILNVLYAVGFVFVVIGFVFHFMEIRRVPIIFIFTGAVFCLFRTIFGDRKDYEKLAIIPKFLAMLFFLIVLLGFLIVQEW